jgi:hypothetical protein
MLACELGVNSKKPSSQALHKPRKSRKKIDFFILLAFKNDQKDKTLVAIPV